MLQSPLDVLPFKFAAVINFFRIHTLYILISKQEGIFCKKRRPGNPGRLGVGRSVVFSPTS
jgi:hypothetical protein